MGKFLAHPACSDDCDDLVPEPEMTSLKNWLTSNGVRDDDILSLAGSGGGRPRFCAGTSAEVFGVPLPLEFGIL